MAARPSRSRRKATLRSGHSLNDEHQTENLVLWTQRSQGNGLSPDSQSGDEDRNYDHIATKPCVTGGDG
jgi:hypothetical protein